MSDSHLAYLSLGSNIEPETHLIRAIQLLKEHGRVKKISSAWESNSIGAVGPDYLNACVLLVVPFDQRALKENVLLPIEQQLGRKRSENKFAPRTMDIDLVIFDNKLVDSKYWEQAFVVIPLAEIYPEYKNPFTHESILDTATRLRQQIWIEARREVLSQFNGDQLAA